MVEHMLAAQDVMACSSTARPFITASFAQSLDADGKEHSQVDAEEDDGEELNDVSTSNATDVLTSNSELAI